MADRGAPTGDVAAEYRQIRTDVGSIFGLHRLITVRGPDAVSFLQGLVSQDLFSMSAGQVERSFFLQPSGKLAALLWVGVGTEEVVLFCDADVAADTAGALARYRIRVKAEIDLDERAVIELWGRSALEAAATEAGHWHRNERAVALAAAMPGMPRAFLVGIDVDALPVGTRAITAIRVEAGEPVMGVDVDHSTIPQECGFIPESVSFTKGCYLGQELVARIDTRGHVNRRLMGVMIQENTVPPAGAELLVETKLVGTFTSPAESGALRAPIGLSLVRRELGDGDPVIVQWRFEGELKTVRATVHDLPLDDFTNP
ncbi:MAG: folate-binding protein YgfZ [Acidimicrobiia bacterium]|nr:folate-binding protein YgfZ [Acidimicrobiia bacterium]